MFVMLSNRLRKESEDKHVARCILYLSSFLFSRLNFELRAIHSESSQRVLCYIGFCSMRWKCETVEKGRVDSIHMKMIKLLGGELITVF